MSLKALPTLLISAESYDPTPAPQRPLIDSRQFGMLIFIVTEVMFFASLVSAYLIIRSGLEEWPPWGQPRLPVWSTAFNTLVLVASGVAAFVSGGWLVDRGGSGQGPGPGPFGWRWHRDCLRFCRRNGARQ